MTLNTEYLQRCLETLEKSYSMNKAVLRRSASRLARLTFNGIQAKARFCLGMPQFARAELRAVRFPLEKQFTGLFCSAECWLPLAKQFTGLFCSAECHSKDSRA